MWRPLSLTTEEMTSRRLLDLSAIGRLQEGTTLAEAQARLAAGAGTSGDHAGLVVPLRDELIGNHGSILLVLQTGIVFALRYGRSRIEARIPPHSRPAAGPFGG